MIRSFRSKPLRAFVETADPSRLSVRNLSRLERILRQLNQAKAPEDMAQPGWRFHPLVGRSKGRYAVDASANWRVTFGWEGQDAVDVDLEDYH